MKPNEAMRALLIEDEAAYVQSDKRMCQIIIIRCTSLENITDAKIMFDNGRYKDPANRQYLK
jgi:hypothetical protein